MQKQNAMHLTVTVSQCLCFKNYTPFKSGEKKNQCIKTNAKKAAFKIQKGNQLCTMNTTAYYKPCLRASSCFQ